MKWNPKSAAVNALIAALMTGYLPAVSNGQQGKKGVDLLPLVDLNYVPVGMRWTREPSAVTSPVGSQSALIIPSRLTDSYRWTIDIERLSGDSGIGLMIVISGKPVMVALDGYGNHSNGLSLLDRRSADRNETNVKAAIFHEGRPTTIVCSVLPGQVHVACDGKTIVHWTGDPKRLAVDQRFWSALPTDKLAVTIYSTKGPFRISRMELLLGPTDIPANSLASRPKMVGSPKSTATNAASPMPFEPPVAATSQKASVCLIKHPLGSGSGFIVDKNLVVTNSHVIAGGFVDELEFHFSIAGSKRARANRLLYEDSVRDLCLLEVESGQPAIPIVRDHTFRRGEQAVLIGNPSLAGDVLLRNAVTTGTVAAVMHIKDCDFYQIDASVNPGSSGGPVLNTKGEAIGVIAMKATARGAAQIRGALKQLDANFAANFNPATTEGVAFGIPARVLSDAMQKVRDQSADESTAAMDRHVATTLLRRLSLLADVRLLELQVNVPLGVRQQASRIRTQDIPTATLNKQTFVPLIPEPTARSLASMLKSDEIKKLVRDCSIGISGRVIRLRESDRVDDATTRDLESLYRAVKATEHHAKSPPDSYQKFSQVVSDQTDELKKLTQRLTERLAMSSAAYDE